MLFGLITTHNACNFHLCLLIWVPLEQIICYLEAQSLEYCFMTYFQYFYCSMMKTHILVFQNLRKQINSFYQFVFEFYALGFDRFGFENYGELDQETWLVPDPIG